MKCKTCNKDFKSQAALNAHQVAHKKGDRYSSRPKQDIVYYICKVCGKHSPKTHQKANIYCSCKCANKDGHSEETKAKLSLLIKGRKDSLEVRKKKSNTRKQLFKDGKISGWDRVGYYKKNPENANKPAILYIGMFILDDISFIKIGITQKTFEERYYNKMYKKYTKILLHSKETTNINAAKLERALLKKYKKKFNFAFPKELGKFAGYSECVSIDALEMLKEELKF